MLLRDFDAVYAITQKTCFADSPAQLF